MATLNPRMSKGDSAPSDPAVGAVAISYGGGNQTLATTGRGIYITTAGNLEVVMQDGSTVTFTGLVVGTVYPFAVRQINQAGSTAAGFILL